jgi:hypothetical protein
VLVLLRSVLFSIFEFPRWYLPDICVGIGLEFDCDILFCGGRYDDMVLEAVLGLNEPDGSSSAAIANYIEVLCSAVLMHMFMFKSLCAV